MSVLTIHPYNDICDAFYGASKQAKEFDAFVKSTGDESGLDSKAKEILNSMKPEIDYLMVNPNPISYEMITISPDTKVGKKVNDLVNHYLSSTYGMSFKYVKGYYDAMWATSNPTQKFIAKAVGNPDKVDSKGYSVPFVYNGYLLTKNDNGWSIANVTNPDTLVKDRMKFADAIDWVSSKNI